MPRTLEDSQEILAKREKAIRLFFELKEKNVTKIAKIVDTSRQNVYNWIKAEQEQRKKK